MKKKTTLILLILTFAIYASNINVQITAEVNNYGSTSLELIPHNPILITSDSDLEVFPGSGTAEDPYFIEGYNITTTSDTSIYITGTTKYFAIFNCYIDARDFGIYINDVADGTAIVIYNTCSYNDLSAIRIESSSNSTVANNTCSNNNGYGISLFSSYSTVFNNTCSNNNNHGMKLDGAFKSTVFNNTCSNNGYSGILLRSSSSSNVTNNICLNNNVNGIVLAYSDSSIVINNTCNNNDCGIDSSNTENSIIINNMCNNNKWEGIDLSFSDNIKVTNNTCNNNSYGIRLIYSTFCVVTYNLLQENDGYGVYLSTDSDNNLFHHNTFVENTLAIGDKPQAYDNSTNNFWYDSATQEGNYWSDWSGTGSYSIDGDADSVDLYPLDEPTVEYSVDSTTDENPFNFTFTLIIVIIPLLLMKLYSRKRLKMD